MSTSTELDVRVRLHNISMKLLGTDTKLLTAFGKLPHNADLKTVFNIAKLADDRAENCVLAVSALIDLIRDSLD